MTKSMNISEKITKDINQYKTAPNTFNNSQPTTASWSMDFSVFNNSYVIAIILGIIVIFGSWFAWDWHNHHKSIKSKSAETGSGSTSEQKSDAETVEKSSGQTPPIVTTMSPQQFAKYKNDQLALENALDPQPISKKQDYVVEDSTASAIQQSKLKSKSGWCYIGEDRGYGSCIKVDEDQFCMSGHVYPSESMCRQVPKQ
jgi:hypothetical protein